MSVKSVQTTNSYLRLQTGVYAICVICGFLALLTCEGTIGCGTVYRLDSSGITIVNSFSGGTDGGYPSNLVRDAAGNLYGPNSLNGSSKWTQPEFRRFFTGLTVLTQPPSDLRWWAAIMAYSTASTNRVAILAAAAMAMVVEPSLNRKTGKAELAQLRECGQ